MAVLNKKQLAHIEKRLLDERSRALRSLGLFDEMAKADRESGDSDLSAYTDHMADQGTGGHGEGEGGAVCHERGALPVSARGGRCGASTTILQISVRATPVGSRSGSSGWMPFPTLGTASTVSSRRRRTRPDPVFRLDR